MAFREASRDTKVAPAEVWRIWADVNSWPAWNPDMKASQLDGPLAVGTTGKIDTHSGGKHDVVVTRYEEGRSFELESTAMPGTTMAIRATITPIDGGTRMPQGFEARAVLAPIVGPIMGGTIPKTVSKALSGLPD